MVTMRALKYFASMTGRLNALYCVLLIAVVGLFSYCATEVHSALAQQSQDAHRIDIAGRQSLLSQRMLTSALLCRYTMDLPTRRRAAQDFHAVADVWETAQAGLVQGDEAQKLVGENSATISGLYDELKPHSERILSAAKTFDTHIVDQKSAEQVQQGAAHVASVLLAETKPYGEGMDHIVYQYQREAEDRNTGYQATIRQLMICGIAGAMLGCCWIYPVSRHTIQRVDRELKAAEEALAAQAEELAQLSAENRSEQNFLLAQREDVEAQQVELDHKAESYAEANMLMQHASRRFQELFDGIPVACYAYDAEGRIFEWNSACETLYGRSFDQMLHRSLWDTICAPKYHQQMRGYIKEAFSGKHLEGLEFVSQRKDGTQVTVSSSIFPLRGFDGKTSGLISVDIDVTARKHAEQHAREQAEEHERNQLNSIELNSEQGQGREQIRDQAEVRGEPEPGEGKTGIKAASKTRSKIGNKKKDLPGAYKTDLVVRDDAASGPADSLADTKVRLELLSGAESSATSMLPAIIDIENAA